MSLDQDGFGTLFKDAGEAGAVGDIQSVGTANAAGASGKMSDAAHVHAHGDQTADTLHALAVAGVSHGFFDKADKTKLNGIAAGVGGSLAPIGTLANLALLAATSYPDGTRIYVNEVEDTYILEKVGSHVADGLCVIAAVGGGFWVARAAGRWDDVQGSIGQGAGTAALTVESYRDTAFQM